jgi:hypothetical protein
MEDTGELPTKKCLKYKELQRGIKKMKTVWLKRCWIYRYLPIHFSTQVYYRGHIFVYHLKSHRLFP